MSTSAPLPAADADSVFRDPAFRRFWLARFSTTIAYQIFTVAVGWQMYDLTCDAFMLGMVGLVQFLPSVVLLLMSGHVADRFDRRRIVRACRALEALVACAMAVASLSGWVGARHLRLRRADRRAARLRDADAAGHPAQRGVAAPVAARGRAVELGRAVGHHHRPCRGRLRLCGRPGVVYAISAVLFCMAAVLVSGLTLRRAAPRITTPVSLQTLFAGIAYIRSRPVLLGAISLDLFAVLLGGATALLPIYARDILHTGPWGLGLLRSSPAIGALAMALWLARHPLQRRVGRIMFGAVALFGAATMVFGLSHWLPLSMAALVVLGASDMISVVVRSTLVQLDTPDEMRGRVGAVNSVFIGASNQLGEFESGVTAALLGRSAPSC